MFTFAIRWQRLYQTVAVGADYDDDDYYHFNDLIFRNKPKFEWPRQIEIDLLPELLILAI